MKLFGIIEKSKSEEEIVSSLKKMVSSFKIEEGVVDYGCSGGVGLGHLTFSGINDKKPIWNEDKSVCIVFTGKIFDYEKEKKLLTKKGYEFKFEDSAAEFILRSYQDKGLDFVSSLNGSFVFAIFDKEKDKLILVNDKYGMRPIYYYKDSHKFVFASEIKAIIKVGILDKGVNWEAWNEIFTFGYPLGNKTPFKQILKMPKGSVIECNAGRMKLKEYWDYENISVNVSGSEEELVKKGAELFKKAIKKQAEGLKKGQILLSGGYDSRGLASGLKKFSDIDFETFTSNLHETGEKDIVFAKFLADKLNLKNTSVLENEDIYKNYFLDTVYKLDCISYEHQWVTPLVKKLKRGVLNFDGLAGDVLIKNARPLPYDETEKNYSIKKSVSLIYNKMAVGSKRIGKFFRDGLIDQEFSLKESIAKEFLNIRNKEYNFFVFLINNRTRNSTCLLPNNLISRKTLSLLPFLDDELVKFFLSIPPHVKDGDFYYKILKHNFPKIMEVPSTNDKSFLKKINLGVQNIVKKILCLPGLSSVLDYFRSRFLRVVVALKPKDEDIDFLVELIKKVEMPPEIDDVYLFKELDKHIKKGVNPGYFLVPIADFCVWYNLFVLEKPLEELKSLLGKNPHCQKE
jgi:asparagine synthase (glutamine-hydrolysing)